MAVIDVESFTQGVPAMVQGIQLRRLRVVVSGLCLRAAGTLGQTRNGRSAEQAALLKG